MAGKSKLLINGKDSNLKKLESDNSRKLLEPWGGRNSTRKPQSYGWVCERGAPGCPAGDGHGDAVLPGKKQKASV